MGELLRLWRDDEIGDLVYGTFLSTLCHEFCHHLDYQQFGFRDSWHTRGFYERTTALYHHARGTPPKRLFWAAVPGGRWRIDVSLHDPWFLQTEKEVHAAGHCGGQARP